MDVEKLKEKDDKPQEREVGLTKKFYTFPISVDSCGKTLAGSFTNRILTNNERMSRDVKAAQMRMGQPFECFSEEARYRQEITAHLIVSLDGDRPDWAEDLGAIEDLNVLIAIYEEVDKHETTFRKPGKDQKSGSGQAG